MAPLLFYRAWIRLSLDLADYTLEVKFYPPLNWMETSRKPPRKPALAPANMPLLLSRRIAGALPPSTLLHVNWGYASAQQIKRPLAEADGKADGLIPLVGDVVRECDICRAFDVAPAIPVAGALSVSFFNDKVQTGLLFLDDLVAPRVLDFFSCYSLPVPVRSKNPA